jgi:hypothetical protein
MPSFSTLPCVADVLDDGATFEPAALAAVRDLARGKPWQGTDAERLVKFNACAAALAAAYRFQPWTIALADESHPAQIDEASHVLTVDRLSVVTFLHFMALARGQNVVGAMRWSINIFRRCFPRSFARMRQVGPYLVTPERAAELGVPEEGGDIGGENRQD